MFTLADAGEREREMAEIALHAGDQWIFRVWRVKGKKGRNGFFVFGDEGRSKI